MVGSVKQKVAGAYGSIAGAISNAVTIKMPLTTSALDIDITSADGQTWGQAGVYADAGAARDSGLTPGATKIDDNSGDMSVNVTPGSYLLIALNLGR